MEEEKKVEEAQAKKVWTIDEIKSKLMESDAWVERALVAIYNRQTATEQATDCTRELNGIGFNGVDAATCGYMARWVLSGKHLSGEWVDRARKRMVKYAKQLVEVANG